MEHQSPHPPFENCRLTTMTLVFLLEGTVNLYPAFYLLPITNVEFTLPKRQKKKFELPHCSTPGAILSMRFSGETRGIIRSTSGRYFKNSITIDLSTKTKNVSIKLSQGKIQMCGASSEEQGLEGAQYIIDHLIKIQDEIDYIQENKDITQATLKWLEEETRGKKVKRPIYEEEIKVLTDEDGHEVEVIEKVFSHFEEDFNIKSVDDDHLAQAPDQRIASFLLKYNNFEYHSIYMAEMEWIISLERVITRPLSIKKVIKAMVNYNYNLGFTVDRFILSQLMSHRRGFFSSYDNCVEHCVNIKLPYVPDKDEGIVRRKNKVPCHCFLVYRSGVVTQTGPGKEKMKEAYDLFWKCILEIKDQIMLEPNDVAVKKVKICPRKKSDK